MQRITAILLGLALPACSASTVPAAAQEPVPEAPGTLEVRAHATVTRAPDRAVIRLAVETLAESAREATAANAEVMAAVLDALRRAGVDRAGIQTQTVALNPRYDRRPGAQPTVVGYLAGNRVTVEVDDVARVGPLVDAAVDAGANQVTGIQFGLTDPESAYHEALEQAIARARREAGVAAAALGVTLGPPVRVVTNGADPPARGPMPELMRAEAAGTPVEPGELEVRATVHITYRLDP